MVSLTKEQSKSDYEDWHLDKGDVHEAKSPNDAGQSDVETDCCKRKFVDGTCDDGQEVVVVQKWRHDFDLR